MMILPFTISETHYSIYVVLGPDNMERIQKYDPAEVTLNKLNEPFTRLQLKDVLIAFATDVEQQEILNMCSAGRIREALRMISRGFRFRPAQGDYDGPYLSAKTTGKEPKQ